MRRERRSPDRRTRRNAPRHREVFRCAKTQRRDCVASGGLETAPPCASVLSTTNALERARGFSPGMRPALAAKRMHPIARMIFAAKAGRAPGGAAQFTYKPIPVFGLNASWNASLAFA